MIFKKVLIKGVEGLNTVGNIIYIYLGAVSVWRSKGDDNPLLAIYISE